MKFKYSKRNLLIFIFRIRALFGVDVLRNAVHGPSNRNQAEHELRLLFGDLKFDKSGEKGFSLSNSLKKKRLL